MMPKFPKLKETSEISRRKESNVYQVLYCESTNIKRCYTQLNYSVYLAPGIWASVALPINQLNDSGFSTGQYFLREKAVFIILWAPKNSMSSPQKLDAV